MDCGTPPVSTFAPPGSPILSLLDDDYDNSQQGLKLTTHLTPALAAAVIQLSIAAFRRYARSHHEYLQQTTADLLNLKGTSTSFQLGQRVKIYMPPTHT
jgi:hypothetical protein